MKKISILCLLLFLSSCGTTNRANSSNVSIANPILEYKTLQEINEIAETNILEPDSNFKKEERFKIINGEYKIAEYQYVIDDVNFTIRSAKTDTDISGVYIKGESAFANFSKDGLHTIVDYPSSKLARWFTNGIQYILIADNTSNLDNNSFIKIAQDFVIRMNEVYSEN